MKIPVVLLVIDGLRPEAIEAAPLPTLQALIASGASYAVAHSLTPFCTLPCHYSMFHSAPATRHGITNNTFREPVRPLPGLMETLRAAGKNCGMIFSWEQLRDISVPGTLHATRFDRTNGTNRTNGTSDESMATHSIELLERGELDFLFCHLDETDAAGHRFGWLEPGYLVAAREADAQVARILNALPTDSPVVIVADHGGHDRTHGVDCSEDKLVPLLIRAPKFQIDLDAWQTTLLDVAPTLATLCGVSCPDEWEGRSLVQRR